MKSLTQVASSALVKEGNVFVNHIFVKVVSKIATDSLRHYAECIRPESDKNTGYLNKNQGEATYCHNYKKLYAKGTYVVEPIISESVYHQTYVQWHYEVADRAQ